MKTLLIILLFSISAFAQQVYQSKGKSIGRFFYSTSDSIRKKEKLNFFNKDSLQKPVQFAIGQGNFNGQVYSELLADIAGSGKLSLGGVITDAKNDSSKTINNFMAGGGNLVINYALPLFWNHSRVVKAAVFFCPRTGVNFPKLSEKQKLDNWNLDLGIESQIEVAGENRNIGLILKSRMGIAGGSPTYRSNFISNGSKMFSYIHFSGGILIKKTFILNLNFKPLIGGKVTKEFSKTSYSSIGLQTFF